MDDDPFDGDLGPGPGPDLDRWLDEAYDGDEHAKAAARADLTAMADHHAVHATDAHEVIATPLWRNLRAMGVPGGRMLVVGQDPEVLAGVPSDERRLHPGAAGGFFAQIPESATPSEAPHPGLTLRLFDDTAPDRYDVVVHLPQHVDVSLHRPGIADARRQAQVMAILGCLAHTEPGGYCITLASREVMDSPDRRSREQLARHGELVGAVRLPSGALRPGLPGNESCVDLLIFRRPLVPGTDTAPCVFLPTHDHRVGEAVVELNQYWLANPLNVFGELEARASTWGPPDLAVRPARGYRLFPSLALRLEDIVDHAHAAGLTAETSAAVDARIREAQRDDPDTPINYTLVHRHDLDDVRRRITALRANHVRQNRNVPKGLAGEPPPLSDRDPRAVQWRNAQRPGGMGDPPPHPPRPNPDRPGPDL
ncbi:hypothetical protein [Antribacter gilvus]|uniref:hypothetical protein n=1 Tax=Antribacter gilvus TaxID=2304675 RepID=UPI000F7716A2|nr:hypothetical protein [Antribacter gilvus]